MVVVVAVGAFKTTSLAGKYREVRTAVVGLSTGVIDVLGVVATAVFLPKSTANSSVCFRMN